MSDWSGLNLDEMVLISKANGTISNVVATYPARVIQSDHPGWHAFEATWSFPDQDVEGVVFETGGRLVEYFSPNHMYNIFQVFRRDGASSGFYANVTEKPLLQRDAAGRITITWIDLWLDVIKLPGGEMAVLDEDEFEASGIAQRDPELATRIRSACRELWEVLASDQRCS